MTLFKKNLLKGIINTIIWVSALLLVYGYVYPQLGMTKKFGAIFITGAITSCCIFEIWKTTAGFISDLKNTQVTLYPLTLPLPSWLYFIQLACSYAIKSMAFGIIILPLGKLILWHEIHFTNFSVHKFLLMFIIINIFGGFLSLFISSITNDMETMRKVWMRILLPLWFLGGSSFPWFAVYKFSPTVAYLFLLNPVTFASEGIRAATIGQKDYLSFWICLAVLWATSLLFGFIAIKIFKRRLNFI